MRNRTRILLLVIATVVMTGLAVKGMHEWYRRPTVLTMTVGPEGSPDARFAARLAEALHQSHSSVRLAVTVAESRAQAVAGFSHKDADITILRTDDGKIPARARALAILEREPLLLVAPRRTTLSTLADLQGKKVVVIGRDGRNEAILRRLLDQYKFDFTRTHLRTMPPGPALDALLPAADVVVMFYPLSRLASSADFDVLNTTLKGFTVHGLVDARALQRKVPGLFDETIEAGLLSGSPRIPDEDMETVSLQKILVVKRTLPDHQVVEIMRVLFESSRQIAVESAFATHIEPPDTEKGALIPAHEGAKQYVDSEVQTFFDRYSDLIYIGMSVGSVLASMAAALYGTLIRRRPVAASDGAAQIMELCREWRDPADGRGPDPDAFEARLDAVLDRILSGIGDGSVSAHGLDALNLAHQYARGLLSKARAGELGPPTGDGGPDSPGTAS